MSTPEERLRALAEDLRRQRSGWGRAEDEQQARERLEERKRRARAVARVFATRASELIGVTELPVHWEVDVDPWPYRAGFLLRIGSRTLTAALGVTAWIVGGTQRDGLVGSDDALLGAIDDLLEPLVAAGIAEILERRVRPDEEPHGLRRRDGR